MWYKTGDTEWEWRRDEKTLVLRGKHIHSILQMGGMMVEESSGTIHEISRHQVKRIVVEEGAESISLRTVGL